MTTNHDYETTFFKKDLILKSNMSAVLKNGETYGYTAVTNENKAILLKIDKKGKMEEE